MSQCSNCYNGCVEITSDKCVRYTGVDVPILGIKSGDSLSFVEQALITFLTATINGTGIQITIDESDYCEVVTKYLPVCEVTTALDLFKALVKASCDLQQQITLAQEELNDLNADYSVDCLEGVENSDNTHEIVQAVITKLCSVDTTLTALTLDVETNYVKLSDLNSLIAAYIESAEPTTRYYNRMIPNVAVEYYGDLTGFDATGAGIVGTEWEKIYLCNGANGTPDHRGRVGVGATTTPGVIPMDSAVNPSVSGNPTYTKGSVANGSNTITLTTNQIPSHTHTATDAGHTHGYSKSKLKTNSDAGGVSDYIDVETGTTSVGYANITVTNTGGGLSHNNYQPGIGTYYIMYIP